ncbi:hypothetical protein F5Y08DRAFT_334227 [Xylaria arbuscula]|nr:hypothetical protein F5Y08DRAFT_334227 [Xylaria arbuscula]
MSMPDPNSPSMMPRASTSSTSVNFTHYEGGGHQGKDDHEDMTSEDTQEEERVQNSMAPYRDKRAARKRVIRWLRGTSTITNTAKSFCEDIKTMMTPSQRPETTNQDETPPPPPTESKRRRLRRYYNRLRQAPPAPAAQATPRAAASASAPGPSHQISRENPPREEKSPVAIAVEYRAPPPQYNNARREEDELMRWLSRPRSTSSANSFGQSTASQTDTDKSNQSMEPLHV